MKVIASKLGYTDRTNGEFRDLRSVEFHLPRRKFARVSFNGQYRSPKSRKVETRIWNPGWSFGTEWVFINWTKFRRHCWHLSFNARKRGVTFSYGRRIV